mmetsp:Transcript_14372/g.62396  ORF Transcript_14372/g.62396 Transcript_14372/m.62396 type:complete len:90 (+) Transcript_14372:226-495(+)
MDILFCFSQERFARRNEEEELRKAFDRLDSTGDGKIDAEELFSLFKWLNHKTSKVRELFFKTCPTFPKTFPSSKLKMSYGKWTTMVINA